MQRRELVQILGMGMLLGPDSFAGALPYRPRFLNDREYSVLANLCDIILPADETSPAASQAGVPFYVDSVLFYAHADEQQQWRSGLAAFVSTDANQREQMVAALAAQEDHDSFFVILKNLVFRAYCLSDTGMRDYLGYRGDTMLPSFPGCTHPEHQAEVSG